MDHSCHSRDTVLEKEETKRTNTGRCCERDVDPQTGVERATFSRGVWRSGAGRIRTSRTDPA
jgi:hypothetical protein